MSTRRMGGREEWRSVGHFCDGLRECSEINQHLTQVPTAASLSLSLSLSASISVSVSVSVSVSASASFIKRPDDPCATFPPPHCVSFEQTFLLHHHLFLLLFLLLLRLLPLLIQRVNSRAAAALTRWKAPQRAARARRSAADTRGTPSPTRRRT